MQIAAEVYSIIVWPARPIPPLPFYMLRFICDIDLDQHIEWERGMGLAGQTNSIIAYIIWLLFVQGNGEHTGTDEFKE